ncbi:MAG TPA: TIGR00730 family Rossman fold protein [Gemmatimonadaceae bacterium]|nr:TIGR00730 family Rossman fold protein [Gemmatimonadaceae bacterium]
MIGSLCVFCGSSVGSRPVFIGAAIALGKTLAEHGIRLVYGGGRVGLMGAIADATLQAGGEVIGVIPQHLVDREVAHQGLTELRIVQSMHDRKALMAELSEGFVALPGGIGTLEEFFEVWTWGQLGLHQKPYALLNVNGFYDPLVTFIDQLVEQKFVRLEHRRMLIIESDVAMLPVRMAGHRTPKVDKVIDRQST